MPSSASVLAAGLALAATAGAVPARIGVPAGSFSVSQVRNTHYVRHASHALAKAYLKFGVPLPDDLAAAVARSTTGNHKRSTGSATTTPEQYDAEYLTPVTIGTPPQNLTLDFDTGSSDLWVFSSETPSNEVDGQTVYNPSESSTAKQLSGATWSISYGDGSSSSGDVYTDVVSVGGLSFNSQAVESAQTVSDEFTSDSQSDGLLGLAFSSINTVSPTPQSTFFENVLPSLSSPVFTADLGYHEPGTYNFGFIDSTAYTGSITYTAVDNSQGFWGFTSSGYAVGSGSFVSKSTAGIADTGTTLLLLPAAIVTAYYKQVKGAKYDSSQGGYTFSCSATLPTFTYGIGSARIVIPGDVMNYAPITDGSSTCFGGLQSSAGIGINIFGDIALKAAFVVFDGSSSPQLGFASKTL